MILSVNSDYFLNSVKKLMLVMVTGCGLFEVRTESLNIILTSFGLQRIDWKSL
jgi:hypothetical protein